MRMVACDLDGTIVRRDGTVSRRTKDALIACERAGVEVVFATGRPPRWVLPIAQLTGHRGVALCGNGAAVLDLSTEEVTEFHPLKVIDVLDAVTRLRVRLPGAAFALETMTGYRREPGFTTRFEAEDELVGPLPELMVDHPPVLKLLVRSTGPGSMDADAMLQIGRQALAGVCEVVHSGSTEGLLELSAIGVTKGAALERLASRLGIRSRDVVAFGDMPNDVEMLSWAGAGYAMTGGHPEAEAAAAALAPPCEEDGVAQVLEQLLFLPAPAKGAKRAPVAGLAPDPVS